MNGESNATNVQGKNYNLHKLQGGHVPQCPIAGDATGCLRILQLNFVTRRHALYSYHCRSVPLSVCLYCIETAVRIIEFFCHLVRPLV